MNDIFNKDLCEMRKCQVDETLKRHDSRLDMQEKRLGIMETSIAVSGEKIDNLITSLDNLANNLKFIIMLIVPTLLGTIASIMVSVFS